MNGPSSEELCGLCGLPLIGDHAHGEASSEESANPGAWIEYMVTGIRGVYADVQNVLDPSDTDRLTARILAINLKTDIESLTGLHYTCYVTRNEYGITNTNFRRISD
jgi:hypothetical protein